MENRSMNYRLEPSPSATGTLLEPVAVQSYDGPGEAHRQGNLLVEYLRILMRKRVSIVLLACAGALLGFLMNLSVLPTYEARTSLDIQSLNGDFMNMRDVAPTGDSANASTESYVQTQIKMLQSDTLLADIVHTMEQQPHAQTVERDDMLSRWKRALHLGGNSPLSYSMVLHDAANRIKVKPLGLTRLVEVTCDSWNADFSARLCNTLTNRFREEDYATRGAEAAKTSEWLTRQVADVRLQVEESEKKLEDATGGNGLVLSQQNTTVSEDRLRQVQQELVRAEADRMEKQAQFEVSQTASADSLPSVIDSPNYRQDQQRLAELRGKVAELVPPLTEENPKVLHLRSQIAVAQAQLEEARGAIVSRLRDEYDSAKHREDLLNVTYQVQEGNTSNELHETNKVNLLRREVESGQNLYQSLLQHAKEAGFASAMQVSTIRIVDAATAPKIPISPRRSSATGVGFLLGGLCGIGLAFYKERTSGVIYFPGETTRTLQLQELGVIPNMRERRGRLARYARDRRRKLGTGTGLSITGEGEPAVPPAPTAVNIWNNQPSIVAEAYRSATFSILLASRSAGKARKYVISSPNAGEGKTTVVSNLGVALSQSQRRVVIVDGDLRKPGLHKSLGLPNTMGLRNVLRGEVDIAVSPLDAFCQASGIPNLSVVTSGTGNEEATELLHSPRAAQLLARLSDEFDLVLIDTPPMLHMADARIFADHADGVILVIRAGSTNVEQAVSARDLFLHDRVRVLGTILNGFSPSSEGKGSYYDSYYRYQDASEDLEESRAGA